MALKRIINAFGYSLDGIVAASRSEPAFRQELLLVLVLLPVAMFVSNSAADKALLISSLFLILMAELINTGLETVINRISEERHPLSKKAKDIGSALVLIAFINALCVWGMILVF